MIAWGTYGAILIDPPWNYRDKCNDGARGAAHKYPTLTAADLAALPVGRLAAPACACFLWVTPPLLPVGLELLAAWGFAYKTVAFTWVKESTTGTLAWGMGHWTRANAEHVLLGVRGRPQRISAAVHSVIRAPRTAHSAKPPEVRARIECLLGPVPRIELFARERVDGWDALGNAVDGLDIRDALAEVPAIDDNQPNLF